MTAQALREKSCLCFQRQVEIQAVACRAHAAACQPGPRFGDAAEHREQAVLAGAALRVDGFEDASQVSIQAARGVQALLEIGPGVHVLQNLEVVLELVDQAVLDGREEDGLLQDRPLESLQALPRDAMPFKVLVEEGEAAVGAQELQVGLANVNVIRRGVVVQLLMPLLHEVALALLQLILLHDHENVVPDSLAVVGSTSTWHAREQQPPHQALAPSVLPTCRNQLTQGLRR
mmetsp:Transcript_164764/g.528621  ORF Transcript_164764/g.528621 Transcript_164764/m.528621 type:complete len:232 (-) Transcript_164764:1334-2029(-)